VEGEEGERKKLAKKRKKTEEEVEKEKKRKKTSGNLQLFSLFPSSLLLLPLRILIPEMSRAVACSASTPAAMIRATADGNRAAAATAAVRSFASSIPFFFFLAVVCQEMRFRVRPSATLRSS
jgi:hypothetical protein